MARRTAGHVTSTQEISQMRDPSKQWRDKQPTYESQNAPSRGKRQKANRRMAGVHPAGCLCRRCQRSEDQ